MLARLYGRLGPRYLWICVAQVWLFSLFMCAVITLLLTDLYLEMPIEQIQPVLGLAVLGTVAGLSVALTHTTKTVTPPLQRWAAGDRTAQNAPAAWEAATRATFTWPAVACVACAVFTVPAELLTLHYGPIPTWQLFLVLSPLSSSASSRHRSWPISRARRFYVRSSLKSVTACPPTSSRGAGRRNCVPGCFLRYLWSTYSHRYSPAGWSAMRRVQPRLWSSASLQVWRSI